MLRTHAPCRARARERPRPLSPSGRADLEVDEQRAAARAVGAIEETEIVGLLHPLRQQRPAADDDGAVAARLGEEGEPVGREPELRRVLLARHQDQVAQRPQPEVWPKVEPVPREWLALPAARDSAPEREGGKEGGREEEYSRDTGRVNSRGGGERDLEE